MKKSKKDVILEAASVDGAVLPEKKKKGNFWKVIVKLRSVWLAIPVVVCSVVLAVRNTAILPALVDFDIAALNKSGQLVFQTITVSKNLAIAGPLVITAVCLGLMFCSKRIVYPWLVSVFSLLLPVLLAVLNALI